MLNARKLMLDTVLNPIPLNRGKVVGPPGGIQVADQIVQRRDADDGKAEGVLYFLHRGLFTLPTLLAIECDQHTSRHRAMMFEQTDGLAHSCSGADYVIDDDDAAGKSCTDEAAAFTVGLDLLAVKSDRDIAAVLIRKRDGSNGSQRNSLVGRAEQHIEVEAGFGQGPGVVSPEFRQRTAIIKKPGVEEIRTHPPRLELELTKLEYAFLDGQVDEFFFVFLHGTDVRGDGLYDTRPGNIGSHANHQRQHQRHSCRCEEGFF